MIGPYYKYESARPDENLPEWVTHSIRVFHIIRTIDPLK